MQSADSANELVQQQNSESRCRYMLKMDTNAECVVLTADMFLVVGSNRGRVLTFNLGLIAYVGGQ